MKRIQTLPYRADIDGLRAIAVTLVVMFHAFPDVLKGGFVGVDIFFVISGFLISGIIFKACDQDGFSFVEFYVRRIRRIFPALVLVLVFTLIWGWVLLLPGEYKALGKHIAASSIFANNFILWRESGYFDTTVQCSSSQKVLSGSKSVTPGFRAAKEERMARKSCCLLSTSSFCIVHLSAPRRGLGTHRSGRKGSSGCR
jgi:peptidoglycan/LPS O-acetylase OafA/YrhL